MTVLTEDRYLIDSSAWIEYFKGSAAGKKVMEIVENNNVVFTPNIVVAEVVSKALRAGENAEEFFTAIKTLSVQPSELQDYFFEAGKEHVRLKEKFKEISLADAIIKVLAEKNKAFIVTKDFHLKGKNTVFLG